MLLPELEAEHYAHQCPDLPGPLTYPEYPGGGSGRHPLTLLADHLRAAPPGRVAADHDGYARIFHGLLDRGIYTAPSGYEAMFPSLAHTDEDIDAVVAAFGDALAAG